MMNDIIDFSKIYQIIIDFINSESKRYWRYVVPYDRITLNDILRIANLLRVKFEYSEDPKDLIRSAVAEILGVQFGPGAKNEYRLSWFGVKREEIPKSNVLDLDRGEF